MLGEDLPDRLEAVRDAGPIGHSAAAHTVLGWCQHCEGRSAEAEVVAWRQLVQLEALVSSSGPYSGRTPGTAETAGTYTPTIELDFDGVLHDYRGYNGGQIGEMMPGAAEAVAELLAGFAVVVCTARRELGEVAAAVRRWFGVATIVDVPEGRTEFWNARGIILVTNRKYPALVYVDDRAYRMPRGGGAWPPFMDTFRQKYGERAVPGPAPLRAAADEQGKAL